ncbi:beta-4C adrenergic receptor-like [Orbicella faveolata]|uniref:beta-4C adrenergic receptor-like n=1 Tax=Orbicella faveolata TaxID=48498 RepID=UPI0009E58693|nr:beta-4C adrenergic receptor-like [Orbicella faveolata]
MTTSEKDALLLGESLHSRTTLQVVLESLIYGFIAAAGFKGNLLALYIVYKTPRLRNVSGLFVASLALSDIAMCPIVVPPSLITLIAGRWTCGFIACQLQGFVVLASVAASLQTMALMSIDRYFRVISASNETSKFIHHATRTVNGRSPLSCQW